MPGCAIRALLGIAAVALGLGGCGGGGDTADQIDSSPTPKGLTVAVPSLPRTLDPALARSVSERAIAVSIHTPLLTYRRSTDTDAATLKPALARTLPTLSGDGTRYRFVLRPGLLYADGRVVTASDVERSISHASVVAADPELRAVLDEIVGAPSADGQTLPGVVTDDRSGAVVVRLRHPDGRIPFALADPATAPLPELPSHTLAILPASTGPMRVARVSSGAVELVSNPLRARIATVPAAHATQISIQAGAPTAKALASGAIDLVLDPPPGAVPDRVASVDASSGAIWSLLLPSTGVLAARPVRQTIADAIDRRGLAAATDPTAAPTTPASRTTPPTLPGSTTAPQTSPTAAANLLAGASAGARRRTVAYDDVSGGVVPACGLLPAYVIGAVVRDDCPPAPTIRSSKPLEAHTLRIAIGGTGPAEIATAQVVTAAVSALGGQVDYAASIDPLRTLAAGRADAAIIRASPTLPHPAGWLAPAASVDGLLTREVPKYVSGPLTGTEDRWSALETRAVDRAIAVPLAIGRTAALVGPAIARSSVLLHPVLGIDLTALTPR